MAVIITDEAWSAAYVSLLDQVYLVQEAQVFVRHQDDGTCYISLEIVRSDIPLRGRQHVSLAWGIVWAEWVDYHTFVLAARALVATTGPWTTLFEPLRSEQSYLLSPRYELFALCRLVQLMLPAEVMRYDLHITIAHDGLEDVVLGL